MLFVPAVEVIGEVVSYWKAKVSSWLRQKSPAKRLSAALAGAHTYEEWVAAAFGLDELLSGDLWRQSAPSKYYDFRLIHERRLALVEAREDNDTGSLVNLLRSGLVRNFGNIASESLYNRAYAGTKVLIEEYISLVVFAIQYVTILPVASSHGNSWTNQAKLDLLHDTRQAFGRSTLVLQGGAVFGLCHLGVIRALHIQGLLPRIITGAASGAPIAALIGTRTEDELFSFVNGEDIFSTAISQQPQQGFDAESSSCLSAFEPCRLAMVIYSCLRRIIRDGNILEVGLVEKCLQECLGDMTFEEAYIRTKRVLNITIPTSGRAGIPNLLNYLTAPNVLVWSAAMLSNNASLPVLRTAEILCKNEAGEIVSWSALDADKTQWKSHRKKADAGPVNERDLPLARVAELFNVNHFIVSQTRPYLVPFLRPDLQHPKSPRQARRTGITIPMLRLTSNEVQHRLRQLDAIGCLPNALRRLLMDETIPGPSLIITPHVKLSDFWRVLSPPTRKSVKYWILAGERSVWPKLCQIRVRCEIEVELDRCYHSVRRRKPLDPIEETLSPRHDATNGTSNQPSQSYRES